MEIHISPRRLDYADDVALISSKFADLQEKTNRLVATTWDEPQMHALHQDRRRGGRCRILHVTRFST